MKKIYKKLSYLYIKKNKSRTLMTFIMIVSSVAFMFSIDMIKVSQEYNKMEAYKKDIKKNEKLLPVSMPINSYMWTGDKFSTWYSGVYEIAIEDDMTKEYAKELAKKFAR